MIEKVVANTLKTHLVNESLTDTFLSAYKRNHSNDTALLWVVNKIRSAPARRQRTVVVLVDLSAAFGTVDHAILLDRLQRLYGYTGVVLHWLESHLSDHK